MGESAGERARIADSGALARYQREDGAGAYAAKYERSWTRRRTDRAEQRLLRRFLARLDPEASLLNVACGAGRFSPILLERPRRGLTYADFSAAMLAEARAEVLRLGGSDVAFLQVDAVKDPSPPPHEIVVNVRMLHHLKEEALRERAFDFLCGASSDALIITVASSATFRGWRRRRRRAGQGRGERITTLAEVEAALDRRGFAIAELGFVSRLFSSQTWILARRRT